jgi:hypothetical protein
MSSYSSGFYLLSMDDVGDVVTPSAVIDDVRRGRTSSMNRFGFECHGTESLALS